MATTKEITDSIVGAVQGYVARCLVGVSDQIKGLAARLDALPPLDQLKGDDGAPGPRGDNGADGIAGNDGLMGLTGEKGLDGAHGEKGDTGPDGADGKLGSQGERGEAGERGDVGRIGETGQRGEAGDRGADGTHGERGEAGTKGDIGAAGADGLHGKDGLSGPHGEKGEKGEKGIDGQEGREGEPGRDAQHVDVLDGIDSAKRYQRGTWATWRGGVIRSFRATDPIGDDAVLEKAGWHIVLRGIEAADIVLGTDLRTVTLNLSFTDGHVVQKSLTVPAVIDRGVWQERGYQAGDGTTWGGSFHIAQRDTGPHEKPSDDSGAWRLSVKKGRDGRDGLKGANGDRGAEGRAGQDLAQARRGPI